MKLPYQYKPRLLFATLNSLKKRFTSAVYIPRLPFTLSISEMLSISCRLHLFKFGAKQLWDLSDQNFVNCHTIRHSYNGGWQEDGSNWLINHQGAKFMLNADDPYVIAK
jgi:hypothetical protein